MRKAAVAAVVVAALALWAACGCGGGASRAKGYMIKGDELLKAAEELYTSIMDKTQTLVTDYVAGGNTEPSGVKAKTDEIGGLLDRATTGEAAAREQYERILPLEGVRDYVKYAGLQIEVIDGLLEANKDIKAMLDVLQSSSDSGQPPDARKLTALSASLQQLGSRIDVLVNQANDLKTGKNLG